MASTKSRLRLAVFDLDYTIWEPEMYQIIGPPKQVNQKRGKSNYNNNVNKSKTTGGTIVTDQHNTEITVFEGASYALTQINKLREYHNMDIQVAVASRTDEPKWAEKCMDWLTIDDGKSLTACFDHVEIGFNDKKWHFRRLKEKTGIEFESMVFFDNEMRNIHSVKQLGVKCVYTPDGMTKEAWHHAMKLFDIGIDLDSDSDNEYL